MAGAHTEGALQLRTIARAVAACTFELSHRRWLAQRSTEVVRAATARATPRAAVCAASAIENGAGVRADGASGCWPCGRVRPVAARLWHAAAYTFVPARL